MTVAAPPARTGRPAAAAFALSLAVHAALAGALLLGGAAVTRRSTPTTIDVTLAPAGAERRAAQSTDDGAAAPRPAPAAPLRAPRPERIASTRVRDVAVERLPLHTPPVSPVGATEVGDDAVARAQAPGAPAATDATAQQGFVELHVLDWLAQHRLYPRAAERAHVEGVVHVSFRLVPDGRIVDGRLERSSGVGVLDGAALELLQRASPIPGIARFSMTQPIELRLPIQYRLRRPTRT